MYILWQRLRKSLARLYWNYAWSAVTVNLYHYLTIIDVPFTSYTDLESTRLVHGPHESTRLLQGPQTTSVYMLSADEVETQQQCFYCLWTYYIQTVEYNQGLKFMSANDVCKTFLKYSGILSHPCTHTHTPTHQFPQQTVFVLAAFQWTRFSAVMKIILSHKNTTIPTHSIDMQRYSDIYTHTFDLSTIHTWACTLQTSCSPRPNFICENLHIIYVTNGCTIPIPKL